MARTQHSKLIDKVGTSSSPVSEVNTEQVSIGQFSTGHTFIVDTHPDGGLMAVNNRGEVVYGPSDLTNSSDLAELWAMIINNNQNAEIKMATGGALRSTQTLNGNVFSITGLGKNRGNINSTEAVGGEDVFTSTSGGPILVLERLKFTPIDVGTTTEVNSYFNLDGYNEIMINNCEFRNAQSYGFKAINADTWNRIAFSYFLAGAGFHFDGGGGANDISLVHNKIANSETNCEIYNYKVSEFGNQYMQSAPKIDFGGCSFASSINNESFEELRNDKPLVDDFNHQNLGNKHYLTTGSTLTFDTSTVLQGSASLSFDSTTWESLLETDYPVHRGYRIRYYVYFDSSTDLLRSVPKISTSKDVSVRDGNGYEVIIHSYGDTFELKRYDGGVSTDLVSKTPTIPQDNWLIVDVDYAFDGIDVTLRNLDETEISSLSSTDTTYSDGFFQHAFVSQDSGSWAYIDFLNRKIQ